MTGISHYWKNLAISVIIAGGMAGLPSLALASGASQANVRAAQQQLKNSGYYTGNVDGVDGPATQAAIRKYQGDNQLKVNGKLDRKTCDKLGVKNEGEASRSAESNPRDGNANANGDANRHANQNPDANQNANRNATHSSVSAAQRSLRKKGFYKGNIDGSMGPETQSAIREFQKNSNLNVTGKLDDATLSRLGVSR